MGESFNWRCPFCGRDTTIVGENWDMFTHDFDMGNKYDTQMVHGKIIVCPNEKCHEYTLALTVATKYQKQGNGTIYNPKPHHHWQLIPESRAQVFPSDIIPQQLLDDYREACLICEKSPKASATLSRRCLQGMIRDFWKVSKDRLADAIEAIKDRVDQSTWEAIDSLRKLGNIGAHMEKDINLIVDVDPNEANLLIDLLETLFAEWYIARHDREERMTKIKKAAAAKDATRKGGTAAA